MKTTTVTKTAGTGPKHQPPRRGSGSDFPGGILAELSLSAEQLAALRRQGFVARERRGRQVRFKLRFRCGGVQCVRYIGSDPNRTQRLRDELARWQRGQRSRVELSRLIRDAHRMLHSAKRLLEPPLGSLGAHFHGFAIRRKRKLPPGPFAPLAPNGSGLMKDPVLT